MPRERIVLSTSKHKGLADEIKNMCDEYNSVFYTSLNMSSYLIRAALNQIDRDREAIEEL